MSSKLKKTILFILVILIIFFGIYYFLKPKDYSILYSVDDFRINEEYHKDSGNYFFSIKKNNVFFDTVIKKDYSRKEKLIDYLDYETDEEFECISNDIVGVLCAKDGQGISPYLVSSKLKESLNIEYSNDNELKKQEDDLKLYNIDDRVYAIWNYKGFNIIDKEESKSITIFSQDVYESDLIAQVNEYILIPDYSQEYYFNKFYVLNLDTSKLSEFEIDYDISFDSYILGTNDKSIYLVDKKEKKEYEIVPHKKKIRIVGTENKQGTILIDGKWEKIGLSKLADKSYSFSREQAYNYYIDETELKLNYYNSDNSILLSSNNVDIIIKAINENVYYLVGDKL